MNEGIDNNKWIIWAIQQKNRKKVIGTICIWNINEAEGCGELGYGIIPDDQGYFNKRVYHMVVYRVENKN
ncbi:GNAT family N-acetyltransferase [Clostridium sp. CF012]|uniref:GNAT family N-acetyltransferase n=1 Tax=Clostridium sp. CF012 TaxID=2843319 RepID=UPI001C0C84B6|nr:hypothetical protein [Clostridium sp. CF012]MBU3143626.1 hypothetical protein [Clostridium sp. CF012]